MKIKHTKKVKQTGKIVLLVIFTIITVGSNPKMASITFINENNNLNKMVDIEQIGSDKIVKANTTEVITVAQEIIENTNSSIAKLNFEMDLGEPSGFTVEQFKKALMSSKFISNDRHDVIKNNIESFYNVEQKYGINGIFVLSIAVHESGWGTSRLAISNNNLFGFVGMSFDSYESCIDYVAKRLMQRYLNPAGTIVKGLEEPATGIYYSGNTIASVNKIYASDNEWSLKVYEYMNHFYKNISK